MWSITSQSASEGWICSSSLICIIDLVALWFLFVCSLSTWAPRDWRLSFSLLFHTITRRLLFSLCFMSVPFSCVNSATVLPKIVDREDVCSGPLQINRSVCDSNDKENRVSQDILVHQHMGFKCMTRDSADNYIHRKRLAVSTTQVPDYLNCSVGS